MVSHGHDARREYLWNFLARLPRVTEDNEGQFHRMSGLYFLTWPARGPTRQVVELAYIGMTTNCASRLRSHNGWFKRGGGNVARFLALPRASLRDAEAAFIWFFRPSTGDLGPPLEPARALHLLSQWLPFPWTTPAGREVSL